MSKKKAALGFPEQLYISICDYDGNDPIFSGTSDLRDHDDGKIAIYQLVEIKNKTTESKLS